MTVLNVAGVRIANIEIDPLRPTVFKLGDAIDGCVEFRAVVAHRAFVNCVIEDPLSGDWEIGEYRYDYGLNTLTRISVADSSNSGDPIDLSKDAVIYQGESLAYIYARRLDVSPTGFTTGAGGTITQLTSKSTGVTINKVCGQIVTHNASLADGAVVRFTVTNSAVTAVDVVVLSIASSATPGGYNIWVDAVADGSFVVAIHNMSGDPQTDAITINFAVIDAVSA